MHKFNISETVYYLKTEHYIKVVSQVGIKAIRTVQEYSEAGITQRKFDLGEYFKASDYLPYDEYHIGLGNGNNIWVKENTLFKDPHDAFSYKEQIAREQLNLEHQVVRKKQLEIAEQEIKLSSVINLQKDEHDK